MMETSPPISEISVTHIANDDRFVIVIPAEGRGRPKTETSGQ
jgi:hypothetical protein